MKIVFCEPKLTMKECEDADIFFSECRDILNLYVAEIVYISSAYQINQLIAKDVEKNDILVFFNSEENNYNENIIKLIKKYNDAQSRIWAIAMQNNPECRRPPEPVSAKQSFDVSCRNENRNPMKNNMKAIAQIFARKLVAQMLSPLYRDEVLYFISHRRVDGEHIAGKLADQLKLLTRERNVYRDVVNVEVGDDAQTDIDDNLKLSDVLIFLQTRQAHNSPYIMRELCYALINNIPVLWIQIDNSSYTDMEIRPGDKPLLSYESKEFDDPDRLIDIVDEIEEKCFQLIMNSSNQVYSYVEYLSDLNKANKIELNSDNNAMLAYEVQYKEKTKDLYNSGIHRHYIQCFGRKPQDKDIQLFISRVKETGIYSNNDMLFLLSSHGRRDSEIDDAKVIEENYDDYLINIENVSGNHRKNLNKRIILSGAFPDCDEIYKNSLLEAVVVYSREIIKNGYTLVFGAHPTFQNLIFEIGNIYATDVKKSIEMHMDRSYLHLYDEKELREKCNLILSDGLQEMREKMICENQSEMLICLGGKIKEDKSLQGVDIEIKLAREANIPIAVVGTVGGRSSEYAYEKIKENNWSDLNPWSEELNSSLFYNVNHRLMINRLLDTIK